jgi:hypothetical protein
MARRHPLTLYLQGHHAAAGAAVQPVRQQASAEPDDGLGRLLARLGDEIAEDKAALREVMGRLGVRPSAVHDASARVGAWIGRWVLRAHGPGAAEARLIGLESLSLGIEGKLRLWATVRALAAGDPRLDGIDLDALAERAGQQRVDLEPHRTEAAREAETEAKATAEADDPAAATSG